MATRLGISDLVSAGARGVSRYTGTLLAVFVVQTVVAAACILAITAVLAQAFAHLPMFDDAVDGDIVAIVTCFRSAHTSFVAVGGIVFGALTTWQLATWFLAGGIYGVLDQRPEGRREVARVFGASGAATYLRYARLALCALPGMMLVLFVLGLGLNMVSVRIQHALTPFDLVLALALGLGPAALLAQLLWTAVDYARVELTLRHDSHAPGVIATYLRSLLFVFRRPLALLFGLLGVLAWIAITCGYAYLAHGHAMYGAEGAITLFVIRQGVSLARMAVRFGVMSGEVELGRTRALPPRRLDAKVDVTA